MDTISIDIKGGDLDILCDGQLILHIGQVSDDDVINLFLYPEGDMVESILKHEKVDPKCTHEILLERK